ncbi:hypothetical protein QU886_27445, partial [Klebsiella pneumoniae]
QAQQATRELAQARVPLSMLRLSNAVETMTQLALAGHPGQIAWLVAMVKPWPWSTARAPQGPPAQNPSMRPAWRWPTICAGGTTTLCTSCSGCRP